jgi:chloramphenicol O-acetyltransferase type B
MNIISKIIVKFISFIIWRLKSLESHHYQYRVKLDARKVGEDLSVNSRSKVNQKTVLGNNVNFNGLRIRGSGPVKIGNNFHSGPDCRILTRNHNYEGGKIPYDNSFIEKEVKIEDNVWMGAEVVILPGVTVEEGAIIQAGSVVVEDVPKCSIVGGAPAKKFSKRDEEHYEELKSKEKFL